VVGVDLGALFDEALHRAVRQEQRRRELLGSNTIFARMAIK
jgi:hypothetical protein